MQHQLVAFEWNIFTNIGLKPLKDLIPLKVINKIIQWENRRDSTSETATLRKRERVEVEREGREKKREWECGGKWGKWLNLNDWMIIILRSNQSRQKE